MKNNSEKKRLETKTKNMIRDILEIKVTNRIMLTLLVPVVIKLFIL